MSSDFASLPAEQGTPHMPTHASPATSGDPFDTAETATQGSISELITPPLPPESCSAYTDENLAGTAAHEKLWVALEHSGNWGRDIFDGRAFDPHLSEALKIKMQDVGARFLLIRRPGREGQLAKTSGSLRVFVADARTAQLFTFTVKEASDLLKLSLDQPQHIAGASRDGRTIALICTHAKRDRCCALRGRPLAAFLDQKLGAETVWECSHTGGHRFAPVGIMLPTGYTYGRLTAQTALAAVQFLEDREVPSTAGLRGRSSLTPPEQAGELAVRRLLEDSGQLAGVHELSTAVEPGGRSVLVRHADGRSWRVELTKKELSPRPNSCGKDPGAAFSWELVKIFPLPVSPSARRPPAPSTRQSPLNR